MCLADPRPAHVRARSTKPLAAEYRSFGRVEEEDNQDGGDDEDNDDENNYDSNNEVVEFLIDGPGGEIIDNVEVRQELLLRDTGGWLCREGHLTWLKVLFFPPPPPRVSYFASAPC